MKRGYLVDYAPDTLLSEIGLMKGSATKSAIQAIALCKIRFA